MEVLATLGRSLQTGTLTLFYKDDVSLELLSKVIQNKIASKKIQTGLPLISHQKAKDKFLILRRVFLLNKQGTYTDTAVLHFLAGWCQFAPEGEEIELLNP